MAQTKEEMALDPGLRSWLSRIEGNQGRIARAIADLARGLSLAERRAGARHSEIVGMWLASLPGAAPKPVPALPSGGVVQSIVEDGNSSGRRREPSVRIRLPEGVTVELPRRKILGLSVTVLKALWYLGTALLLGAHWLFEHAHH